MPKWLVGSAGAVIRINAPNRDEAVRRFVNKTKKLGAMIAVTPVKNGTPGETGFTATIPVLRDMGKLDEGLLGQLIEEGRDAR